jgi:hypothetical protein
VDLVLPAKPAQAVPAPSMPPPGSSVPPTVITESATPTTATHAPATLNAAPGAVEKAPNTPPPSAPTPAAHTAEPAANRWVGYTALAVGGVGIAAGSVFGLSARSKLHSAPLSNQCSGTRCPPEVSDNVETYNNLRTYSMVSFGVGAVGLVSGIVLTWLVPRKSTETPVAIDVLSTRQSQQLMVRWPF